MPAAYTEFKYQIRIHHMHSLYINYTESFRIKLE